MLYSKGHKTNDPTHPVPTVVNANTIVNIFYYYKYYLHYCKHRCPTRLKFKDIINDNREIPVNYFEGILSRKLSVPDLDLATVV